MVPPPITAGQTAGIAAVLLVALITLIYLAVARSPDAPVQQNDEAAVREQTLAVSKIRSLASETSPSAPISQPISHMTSATESTASELRPPAATSKKKSTASELRLPAATSEKKSTASETNLALTDAANAAAREKPSAAGGPATHRLQAAASEKAMTFKQGYAARLGAPAAAGGDTQTLGPDPAEAQSDGTPAPQDSAQTTRPGGKKQARRRSRSHYARRFPYARHANSPYGRPYGWARQPAYAY